MGSPKKTLYPFAEMFEVETNAQVSVDIWDIPAGTIITMVLAKVKVAGTGSSANIIVGDDDEDDGYILAAAVCGTATDVVYGDSAKERGEYLTLDEATGIHAGHWKVYTAAGKELKMDCSASLTTEAIMDIFVFGYRYHED